MKKFWVCFVILLGFVVFQAQSAPEYKRTEDIIYGRKFGTALTLDVIEPVGTNNGVGIIFMVSGGFFSSHEAIAPLSYKPFLKRGYTMFAVVHGSQPKFTIPEIQADIQRAVRFIRHNARQYKVAPDRLGITGGSAGGHLSLTMATQGGKERGGKDEIDRESSEVQCVACFFPPTDFLNYGKEGEDAVGVGTLKQFKPAFGPRSDTPEERQKLGKEISPIYFVHSNMPPILIIHGDADTLVPIYQSKMFVKKCEEVGSPAKLIVKEGKNHGWSDIGKDMETFVDWFDEHLRSIKPSAPSSTDK